MYTRNYSLRSPGQGSGGRPHFNRRPHPAGPRFSGGSRPPMRGGGSFRGRRTGGGVPGAQYIDPTKFVNKAVITEEIEHFVPEHAFIDFKIEEKLKQNIVSKGYVNPTPIQDRAIPH